MRDLGILSKVQGAINSSEYGALVIVSGDNVQYLTGAPLPAFISGTPPNRLSAFGKSRCAAMADEGRAAIMPGDSLLPPADVFL
jgi:hypothetical protein